MGPQRNGASRASIVGLPEFSYFAKCILYKAKYLNLGSSLVGGKVIRLRLAVAGAMRGLRN